MSKSHPIIAITGASGSGTSFIKQIFLDLLRKKSLLSAEVDGDSFHRYNRREMRERVAESKRFKEQTFTHYCEQANYLDKLQELFSQYSQTGRGRTRNYIHTEKEAKRFKKKTGLYVSLGDFTPWKALPNNTNCLLYEGLHGGAVTRSINIAQYVDLLIGVSPSLNIEWMQKIWRDSAERPYTPEQVTAEILDRMPDYMTYITPQFDRTHVNFHRVPLIDTSNPFSFGNPKPPPEASESLIIVSCRSEDLNLKEAIEPIEDSYLSTSNTAVVPGTHFHSIIENLFTPFINRIPLKKHQEDEPIF